MIFHLMKSNELISMSLALENFVQTILFFSCGLYEHFFAGNHEMVRLDDAIAVLEYTQGSRSLVRKS